jgi:uncharacterized protein (UPF0335 family)
MAKKIVKGTTTNTEKFAIQGMLAQKIPVEEIAKQLGRTKKTIQNYIDTELEEIYNTVVESRIQQRKEEEERQENEKINVDEDIIKKVYRDLLSAGLTKNDAANVIDSALEVARNKSQVFKDSKHLYTACIQRMRAGHFITKKTAGGNEGVAIMSQTASTKADSARKNMGKGTSRSARGNVYNIKKKEIE